MIYIVIRKTLDWNDEAAFRAQIPDEMRAGVDVWNAVFNMPYHVYRRELKHIAQLNVANVEGACRVPQHDVPEGALAVPADDDDWFAPELGRTLEQNIAGCTGCYWPSRFLEVPISLPHRIGRIRKALFPGTKPRWLCTTNNYAVVFGPETVDLLEGHIRATRWFLAHAAEVTRVGRPLSLMNRSLASTTHLRLGPSQALLLRKHRQYRKLYRKEAPSDLSWAESYIAMMRDLHAELTPRKR